MRISAALCSWYENQISNTPLANRARQTTATNRPTYLRNSRPRTLASRENRRSTRRSTPSGRTRSSDGMESPTYAISPPSGARSNRQRQPDTFASFDHLVRPGKQRWRDGKSERFCSHEIDSEIEAVRLLDRQVGRPGALQDLVHQDRRSAKHLRKVHAIANQGEGVALLEIGVGMHPA